MCFCLCFVTLSCITIIICMYCFLMLLVRENHPYILALLAKLGGYIYEAHFECHDILMLGKSPI